MSEFPTKYISRREGTLLCIIFGTATKYNIRYAALWQLAKFIFPLNSLLCAVTIQDRRMFTPPAYATYDTTVQVRVAWPFSVISTNERNCPYCIENFLPFLHLCRRLPSQKYSYLLSSFLQTSTNAYQRQQYSLFKLHSTCGLSFPFYHSPNSKPWLECL